MNIQKLSSKYTVRRLTEADLDIIYELSVGNPLYYQHCPPNVTKYNALDDMRALPPQMTYDDKYYIGFFEADSLIAIMDIVLQYPNQETAYIGFFMMAKASQGTGIGSFIITECCNFMKMQGYRYVRLGYVKTNPQSKAFWLKNGFEPTGVERDFENYTVVVLQKTL